MGFIPSYRDTHGSLKHVTKILEAVPEAAPVFSVSPNGHIREQALKKWQKIGSAFELSLLLIRLNDWVMPVQIAAADKLAAFMSEPPETSGLTASSILGCMDLILDLNRFGRIQEIHSALLFSLTERNETRTLLKHTILSDPSDIAPRYLKLALRHGLFSDDLSDIAVHANHDSVRAVATMTLLKGVHTWKEFGELQNKPIHCDDLISIAAKSLKDSSPRVQKAALDYIIQNQPATLHTEDIYRRFITSKHMSVVDRAAFGLRRLGVDWIDEIRQNVISGESSKRAISLLARYGTSEDADILYNISKNFQGIKRLEILGEAVRWNHKDAIEEIAHIALSDDQNSVAKKASKYIRKSAYSPDPEIILEAIYSGKNPYKRGYIALIGKLKTMDLARVLASIEIQGFEHKNQQLWYLLAKKRNTGAFLPTQNELNALNNITRGHKPLQTKVYLTLGLNS